MVSQDLSPAVLFCANNLKMLSACQRERQPGSAGQLGGMSPFELWSRTDWQVYTHTEGAALLHVTPTTRIEFDSVLLG